MGIKGVMKVNKLTVLTALFVAVISNTQESYSGSNSAGLLDSSINTPKVTIERAQRGIPAKLLDQDDYYFHPDGRKLKFYRKKDVYLVKNRAGSRRTAAEKMQRFKGQYGDRVKAVDKHQFGSSMVVRLDNRQSAKTKSQRAFDIKPEMLASLDSETAELTPIFTIGNGQDDLLLLPKVTLELNDSLSEEDALAKLKRKYGLSLVRKLELSADVYSLAFSNTNIDSSRQFKQVRRLMREPFVAWAEPQFYFKPIKAQYTPNDTLFNQQWNLRDQGYRGSRCDTDCDADNAWGITSGAGAATGAGMVIAIIDDGVQLNHPDLSVNTANDKDFVDDVSANTCVNGQPLHDGNPGPDFNASPRATANCFLPGQGEPLEEDNHGTAVAGIAAAVGDNAQGIAGAAYGATILPIRAISDFDEVPLANNNESFCNVIAEAMEYAAQYADVLNNSWSLPINCTALDSALTNVTAGTVTVGLGSKRANGSPVIFASGNNASGWVKVTVAVTAGEHAYEWRLLRSAFPEDYEVGDDDTAWLDDIVWPDGTTEGFESGLGDFTTDWVLNSCDAVCTSNFGSEPVWDIESQSQFVRSGAQSARIQGFVGGTDSDCGNSYLHTLKDGPAGSISFWVWVSTDTQDASDKFEFLIDGQEVLSYGDIPSFGFVDNAVAYPAKLSASNSGVVAVGASKSGDLSGNNSVLLAAEERASYSQFGAELDIVAPSSDQHLGITTTDRTGADGYGSGSYTSIFGGTSASAPVVSGIAAAMLAIDPSLSAADVKTMLRNSADKIGPIAYTGSGGGRNDYHGYGRVNMFNALRLANNQSMSQPAAACNPDAFDYFPVADLLLPRYQPQPTEFCPARGPLPEVDEACFVIKAANGAVAVFCL